MPKKKRFKAACETDVAFLTMMDGFINFSKEAIQAIKQPQNANSSTATVEDVDDECKLLAKELDKFDNIGPTYRVPIGLKLVQDKGLRTYFLNMCDDNKFEYIGVSRIWTRMRMIERSRAHVA